MLDIYGRERHPENSGTGTDFLQESYNDRRQRAQMMLYTLSNLSSPPNNRYFLIDEEGPEEQRPPARGHHHRLGRKNHPDPGLGTRRARR